MKKTSISTLTPSSQKKFAKLLNLDDLRILAELSGKVKIGKITIKEYQDEEKKMIKKYGLAIKK